MSVVLAVSLGLVELPLPLWAAHLFRVLLWFTMLITVGRLVEDAAPGAGLASTRWERGALIVLLSAEALLMAERWNQPLTVEISVAAAVSTACALRGTILYRRGSEHASREAVGMGPRYGRQRSR